MSDWCRWYFFFIFTFTLTLLQDRDSYEELVDFISTVARVPNLLQTKASELPPSSTPFPDQQVFHFIIHARKCWTNGVNTRENRRIPPLQYDWVFRLLDDFPTIDFTLNGGVKSFCELQELLDRKS